MTTGFLKVISPIDVAAQLNGDHFSFIGTISFEERSSAWPLFLAKRGVHPYSLYLFDYDTKVEPIRQDKLMRERCYTIFRDWFKSVLPNDSIEPLLNAFALHELVSVTEKFLANSMHRLLLIDITCMTRVHLIALAQVLTKIKPFREVIFCYASPRSYGFQKGVYQGWKDTLFIPIAQGSEFRREGHARGIAFAGHYGERLSVALNELEPESGQLLYTKETGRPDLLLKARELNKFIEDRLLMLWKPGESKIPAWTVETIGIDKFKDIDIIIANELDIAEKDNSPIVIYPFGPKPLTFATLMSLAEHNGVTSIAVYPVPEKFDAGYSAGISQLHCFQISKSSKEALEY